MVRVCSIARGSASPCHQWPISPSQQTATPQAPWYVVPADKKWYTRLVVAAAIIHTLEAINLRYPVVSAGRREALKAARAALEYEGGH
jgi:hypothetical protein